MQYNYDIVLLSGPDFTTIGVFDIYKTDKKKLHIFKETVVRN